MPIVAWYILAVSPAVVLLLIDGARMLMQRRARRRLTAATLDHAKTMRRLEALDLPGTLDALRAHVTASDYEPTPIHDELAVEHLRRDLDQWGREGA